MAHLKKKKNVIINKKKTYNLKDTQTYIDE